MSRHATARLFVALDPPARVREELAAWGRGVAAALRGRDGPRPERSSAQAAAMRVLEPHLLHITLAFLGSRPVEEMQLLADALEGCAAGAPQLAIGAPLWLPPRAPRSLAVEIHEPLGRLDRLQGHVAQTLAAACSWEPERRRFRAHVTVARVRGRSPRRRSAASSEASVGGGALVAPPTPQLRFAPCSLSLYRSWLAPEGASYEAIASFPLAGEAG